MYFSRQALQEMSEAREAIGSKYESLLMLYVTLPLKDATAKEYATQGFPRRLGVMAHCIHNVFTTLPPEKEEIPSKTQLFDATVNIQAFLVNTFGCVDNLARIWIHEKSVTTVRGKPLPKGEIGLAVHHTRVRRSLSKEFQDYLKKRDEWLTFMGNFRHALAHRIPLYIPPYAVRPQDEAAYNEFKQKMIEASKNGELAEHGRLVVEQQKLMRFLPWIHHSYLENGKPAVFHPQLLADFHTVEELGLKMHCELMTELKSRN
jgi:hypothetical protein